MKTNKFTFIITILTFALILFGCNDSTGPTFTNNGGNALAGAYILCYSPATSTDYAYYDAVKDSVTDFVFTSNNPGVRLNVNPGEMKLNSDRKLYITTRGIPGDNGTIYKIDPATNSIEDSLRYGTAPYGFTINNNRIIVGNSGSTNLTVLDLDFNIIKDTIEVGSNPANVLYGFNKYIVTRNTLNNEPSAAFVDEINYAVTKLFYPAVPAGAIYNVNGIFISTNLNSKIYRVDPGSITTIDSFAVPSMFSGIGKLVFRTQNSFYVIVSVNEVWLATVYTGTISFTKIFATLGNEYIRNAAYEQNANELYFISETNPQGAILYVIDGNNGNVKRTKTLSGINFQSIVFRYF